MLEELKTRFLDLEARAIKLAEEINSGRNAHFESLASRPDCIFSRSLRDVAHYAERRSSTKVVSEFTVYDANLDALKVIIPPLVNEFMGYGLQYRWTPEWNIGSKIVVQIDQMIARGMREFVPVPGLNGRFSQGYKFTNITSGSNNSIYTEFRPWFRLEPGISHVDFRHYGPKLEGVTTADGFASDLVDPSYVGPRRGEVDTHPGPDSMNVRNRVLTHPQQFKLQDDTWVRATYEIERVAEGCRTRIWLADEQYGPSLVVCSPTDPAKGFLSSLSVAPTGFYIELDGSQETTYATPQPERAAYFRNLVVLRNVQGEEVLGGRPKR